MQDMIVLRAVLGGMAARYAAARKDATLFNALAASLKTMRAAADRDDEKAFFDEHWHFYERSEEHTSELQSLMRISYAVFCLKKTKQNTHTHEYTKQYDTHNYRHQV